MTKEVAYGLLINYEYCTGCHSCEVSCQMEHDLPVDRWGIKIQKVGPWQIAESTYQYDFVPVPTDQCDLCAARTGKGKKPLCVKHCQSLVMEYGTVSELAQKIDGKTKTVLFVPKSGTIA
jgi:anaerobic dimethyl sulfoxide reductase subunit B (iron-sulfur subunit)